MRARVLGVLLLAMAVGLLACSAPTARQFGRADQDAIRKLVQDFVVAYNAKDLQKIGTLFAGNGVIMPANRSTLRGVDLVKTYFDERFKSGASNLEVVPQDVSGNGPLAYVTATFSLELNPPDGSPSSRDRGKVLWIVHEFNGQWKFECQIMSSDLPATLPAPPATTAPEKEKEKKKK